MSNPFLDDVAIRQLTGRRQPKRQVEQLRLQGIPFYLNAAGRPVVASSAVDGRGRPRNAKGPTPGWTPAVLKR